jgi:ATP-dependent DNA ligase
MTFKKLDLNAGFRSFAVVSLNGIDLTTQLRTENQKVFDILELEGKYLKKVEGRPINNSMELNSYFDEIAKANFEGLVAKDLRSKALPNGETGYWVKLKRFYSADLVILGFTKEAKHLSLVLGFPDGRRITNCGNGFTFREKGLFHEKLAKKVIREDRENYYVEPKMVIEIKHQGIIYNPDGTISSVRMPIFLRLREDKTMDECGFDPIYIMGVA